MTIILNLMGKSFKKQDYSSDETIVIIVFYFERG